MPITLNVNDLMRLANAQPESSIIVKNGGFQSVGKSGAFFASKTECRLASQAFLAAIRSKYGDNVADALAPDLRALINAGKPLSARTALDIAARADEMSHWMRKHNVMLGQKFLAGNGLSGMRPGAEAPIAGNTVNMDTSFAEFCAQRKLNPAGDPAIRALIADQVLAYADKCNHMISVAEMRNIVLSDKTMQAVNTLFAQRFESSGQKDVAMRSLPGWNTLSPAQQAEISKSVDSAVQDVVHRSGNPVDLTDLYLLARNVAAARAFDISGQKDAAIDAVMRQHHLDPNRRAVLAKAVDMALQKWTAQKPDRNAMPPSMESLGDAVGGGKLPGLKNLFYAIGLQGHGLLGKDNASRRDVLSMAVNSPHLADFAMLIDDFSPNFMPGVLYALQKIPAMRALQPEGRLTPDTIWQGCFNSPMPEKLRSANAEELGAALFDALLDRFRSVTDSIGESTLRGPSLIQSGIKEEKVLQYFNEKVSIGLDDFVSPPCLTVLQQLPRTVDLAEQKLAIDIHRDNRTVTFFTDNLAAPPAGSIKYQDTSRLSPEELAAWKRGQPSPVSQALVAQCRALCDGNDAQLRQVVFSLSQSGTMLVRGVSFASSDPAMRDDYDYLQKHALSEHSDADIDVRRQPNGDITMRYHLPEDSEVHMDYTFTVKPDGTSMLSAFQLTPRQ